MVSVSEDNTDPMQSMLIYYFFWHLPLTCGSLVYFWLGVCGASLVLHVEAPLLVGMLANKDPAAKKYAEWTGKACRADGLRYELRELDDPIDVERALRDANDDPRVHGIIVYYPIFGQVESFSGASQDDYLRDSVDYKRDVEGLCHLYRTNLYRNIRYLDPPTNSQKCLLPCTALSTVKILEECPGCYDMTKPIGRRLEGKVVTVINRSEIVGRPLAAMLSNDGATVYSVDINSIYRFEPGGRLEKCDIDDTPESCVRKVRHISSLFCQMCCSVRGSSPKYFTSSAGMVGSPPSSSLGSRRKRIVYRLNGFSTTLPS